MIIVVLGKEELFQLGSLNTNSIAGQTSLSYKAIHINKGRGTKEDIFIMGQYAIVEVDWKKFKIKDPPWSTKPQEGEVSMARKRTEDYLAELSNIDAVETSAEPTTSELTNSMMTDAEPGIVSPVNVNLTPEAAADILLSKLEPAIRTYAIEVADLVLKIPRWQLVLGTLMAQYQSGALVAPYIDPSWQVEQIVESASKCERCGKDFVPHRLRQRFCSNECGSLSILERKGVVGVNP
jgi:hypothetical protein